MPKLAILKGGAVYMLRKVSLKLEKKGPQESMVALKIGAWLTFFIHV